MDDEWSQLPIDLNTGVKVIDIGGSNPLPVMPSAGSSDDVDTPAFGSTDVGTATSAADVETGPLAKLFGTAGNERYQTWPEKLIRSAVTAPADALAGNLAPEDEIPRALDMASLAGVGPLAIAPGEASLGSGMIRMATNDVAPVFYSAVENAVKDAKLNVGTADQWLGYLKNQPGVKQEELDWTLGDLPTDGKLTKADVQAHVDANKVQVQDVNKGEMKFNENSKYNLPAVKRAIQEAGDSSGELELTLANDGDAYRALTKKFPELADDEDWAAKVANDFYGGDTKPTGTTKFEKWQLPGGSNYSEKLLTLPGDVKPLEIKPTSDGNWGHFVNGKQVGSPYPTEQAARIAATTDQRTINALGPVRNADLFRGSHWDEPNVLAHVRMNDRNVPTDAFTVQNIQSGNRGPIFETEAEAKAYQDSLPASTKTKIVPTTKQNKTLHLEEIQSDWHQKGRAEGYKITPEQKTQLEGLDKRLMDGLSEKDIGNPDMKAVLQTAQEKGVLTAQEAKNYADWSKGENSSIPNAPFKSSWSDLALKRMIRHASENGYDAISWTPGEAQAARYDLSKQINNIRYKNNGDDTFKLSFEDKQGTGHYVGDNVKAKDLEDKVGKEIAEKIINGKGERENLGGYGTSQQDYWQKLANVDLKIGGEGMKAFYDKMLVDKANNIAKKYGGRVEEKNLSTNKKPIYNVYDGNGNMLSSFTSHERADAFRRENPRTRQIEKVDNLEDQPIHFLKLPQGLKDTAMQKGFPLFAGGFPISAPLQHDPFQDTVEVNGKTIPVNNKQDVPDLAGASTDSDTVNIDKAVPRYDPKFKVANGQPGDIYKYLAIHETDEKAEMEKQISAFTQKNGRQPNAEEMHRIYLNAHYGTATPNEHAAIIADGGNPKDYEDVLHGYEKKTENEKNADVPQNLYRKVYSHSQLRNMRVTPVKGNPFDGN